MKNVSLQSDLRANYSGRSINARILWLAGLIATFVFVLWPNAGPAYASATSTWSNENGVREQVATGYNLAGYIGGDSFYDSQMAIPFTYTGTSTPVSIINYHDWIWRANYSGTATNLYRFYTNVGSNPTAGTLISTSNNIAQVFDCGNCYREFNVPMTASGDMIKDQNYWLVISRISDTQSEGNAELVWAGFSPIGAKTNMKYNNGTGWYSEGGSDYKKYFSVILEEPPTDAISIIFPENATSTPDFSLWSVSGYALDSGDTIEVLSQATSSNTWVIDGGRYLGDIGSFSDFVIVKNTSAIPDIYRAYATLYHGIDIVATSTEIVYTITGANPEIGGYYGESGYYPDTYPTSTASSSDWVITCDPTDPLFTRSICQISKWTLDGINALLQFLFIPKSSDLNQFNNLKSALENKPPFGYFYAIKDALIFNSTTTKAFDIASSTLAMVSPIFNPLKTGITFILWLLFAFWVFNRLRNFHFI